MIEAYSFWGVSSTHLHIALLCCVSRATAMAWAFVIGRPLSSIESCFLIDDLSYLYIFIII